MRAALGWRHLGRDAVVYGLSGAVSRLAGLITTPLLAHFLTPADFGAIALLQGSLGVLVVLIGLNLDSGTYRHYYEDERPARQASVVTTSLAFYVGAGLLAGAATWLVAPSVSALFEQGGVGAGRSIQGYAECLRVLAFGVPFSVIEGELRGVLRLLGRSRAHLLLTVFAVLAHLGGVLALVVLEDLGLVGALWANVLASAASCGVAWSLARGAYAHGRADRAVFRCLAAYGLPQLPAVLLSFLLQQSNTFFLAFLASEHDLGLFTLASKVAGGLALFTTAFRLAWDPYAMAVMNAPEAARRYRRGFATYYLLFAPLAVAVGCFARPIIELLTPPEYHGASASVGLLAGALLVSGGSNFLGIGIAIRKKTHLNSVVQLLVVAANTAANLALIPWLGARGAALAWLVGVALQGWAFYALGRRLQPIPFDFWRLTAVTAVQLALVSAHTVLTAGSSLAVASVWGALTTVLAIVMGVAWSPLPVVALLRRRARPARAYTPVNGTR